MLIKKIVKYPHIRGYIDTVHTTANVSLQQKCHTTYHGSNSGFLRTFQCVDIRFVTDYEVDLSAHTL